MTLIEIKNSISFPFVVCTEDFSALINNDKDFNTLATKLANKWGIEDAEEVLNDDQYEAQNTYDVDSETYMDYNGDTWTFVYAQNVNDLNF